MAWQSFKVEKYEVCSIAYNTQGFAGLAGFINLVWEGKKGATLWFYRGSDNAPTPNHWSTGVAAYYAMFGQAQFPDVVDVLRNEKPVFFQWNEASKGARISTSEELVGEEESP